ncbi:hypothetical protein A2U01_0117061, partial [Trifolium medium]|nr:hypothetical protein [Trifolium medium]
MNATTLPVSDVPPSLSD